ncbi:hypothetical protein RHSIM_Rhsim13G0074200 [Rhododendron simsii]|uniref:Uncharacterized protein n=1 Tax=Rhododendron simsii TaxID=118357 RepID=A0A834G4B6_RHOSS|nr:hypothetical protein RHSIM_Rhsim13G0074200 [Rhododendron simsii]
MIPTTFQLRVWNLLWRIQWAFLLFSKRLKIRESQGDRTLSQIAPMVTDPMKPINEGKETWNEPIVLDSRNNIRASQVAGINLMVDFRPKEVNGKNRSQAVGEDLDLIESSRTSVPSFEVSGYIADTPDQEQYRIAEELQKTITAGTKFGIKYDDDAARRMKKMIEQEAKDLEFILRESFRSSPKE